MTITPKTITLTLIISITMIILWIIISPRIALSTQISTSAQSQMTYETKERTENNVTVSITPRTLSAGTNATFQVGFETHSVELDFDVTQIVQLTDDTGKAYGPAQWVGSPPGGHHRSGTLTFSQPVSANAGTLRLTLTDIAGIPTRVFEWKKGGEK